MFKKKSLTISIIATIFSTAALADAQLDDLQQQIKTLQSQLEQTSTSVDSLMRNGSNQSNTSIGGYGEMHYNNLDSGSEIDFHRFVLFFNHEFTDRLRFFSELELEHSISGEGQVGEVELEQAAIQFDINNNLALTGGLFLMPVGIINETHEPTTFYGVERNPVEKNIIPTTWWEGGAMISGKPAPAWSYDVAVTSGLSVPTSGSNAYKIRNGRQKVAEAPAEDLAITGRLQWQAAAGTQLGITLQSQNDVTQGTAQKASATLLETHAAIQQGPFGLRALYAAWDINSTAAEAVGRNKQTGWYVEPSYKLSSQWGLFARYNNWDNEAGNSSDSTQKQTNIGANYWPHPSVVVKADFQNQSGSINDDGFNLGLGYQF
ncbi:MAG: porin [Pseudomonadota bacterium]|nr:porin [Pseudomonadota bacterium]